MTSETTRIGAGESSPAPDGSALVDALSVLCHHVEELERIAAETKACVLTCDAKGLAAQIVETLIAQNATAHVRDRSEAEGT